MDLMTLMGRASSRSTFAARLFCLAMVGACGCSLPVERIAPEVEFRQAYQAAAGDSARLSKLQAPASGALVTLSADAMNLGDLSRWLAREHGVSIICASQLQGQAVTIDVKDMPLVDFLRYVARRCQQEVTCRGSVYYLGEVKPDDRTVVVRRVYRLKAMEAQNILRLVKGNTGQVIARQDGIVILADTVWACQAMCDLLDKVEAATVPQWCLQLHLISVTDRQARELGMDMTPAVEVSASLAGGVADPVRNLAGKIALGAILRCARENGFGTVEAQPLLMIEDGGEASFQRGLRVPVARRVVSPQGTVSIESFESVDTGLTLKAGVREAGPNLAHLTVNVESREQIGSVEGVPITDGATWNGTVTVESGGVYLLGEISRTANDGEVSGPFQLSWRKRAECSRMQIWAQVIRIGGPVGHPGGGIPIDAVEIGQ